MINPSFLLDLIFPTFCANCNRLSAPLCDHCYEQLDFLFNDIDLQLQPNYLDQLQSAVHYQGPIKPLIKEMKYLSVKPHAHWCGILLHQTVNYPQADIITSIPLHPKRQQERGFNQAEEIAQVFAEFAYIPYQPLLERRINTPHQASFEEKKQRLHSLDQALSLINDVNIKQLKNKSVIIIDDVVTTGTTLNQAAKILKSNGVKKVFGLAVAHD